MGSGPNRSGPAFWMLSVPATGPKPCASISKLRYCSCNGSDRLPNDASLAVGDARRLLPSRAFAIAAHTATKRP
jgi:hypothetical protein